jgi:hypothetical protein
MNNFPSQRDSEGLKGESEATKCFVTKARGNCAFIESTNNWIYNEASAASSRLLSSNLRDFQQLRP